MFKKIPKTVKERRFEAIRKTFNRYYQCFLYPFIKVEEEWNKKNESERWRMYEDVTNWVKSDAYKLEHENIVREFYQKLASESQTEEQIAGYRLCLLFIKSWEIRLKNLSDRFTEIKILEQRNKKLN